MSGDAGPPTKRLKQSVLSFQRTKTNQGNFGVNVINANKWYWGIDGPTCFIEVFIWLERLLTSCIKAI